jgi:hypothetical protein
MREPFMTAESLRLRVSRPAEDVITTVLELAQRPRTQTRVVRTGLFGRREETVEEPTRTTFRFSMQPSNCGWFHPRSDTDFELDMWVLEFKSSDILLIMTPFAPGMSMQDYLRSQSAREFLQLRVKIQQRLTATELSGEEVQAIWDRPHRLVCPPASGQSGFHHLVFGGGEYREPVSFVIRDASSLAIDRASIWQAEYAAIETVRHLRGAGAPADDLMLKRNPWGVITVSGTGIVSAPDLAVAALAINRDRRILAVAEETEQLHRRQLRDRNPMEWALSGGDRGKVYPVWILRDDLEPFRVEVLGDVQCMDLSVDGSLITLLEWTKDPVVAIIDVSSGLHRVVKEFPERQFTTRIARLHGDERVAFSPDGIWILVSGDTGGPGVLIEVASGAVVDVPLGDDRGATWWPQAGPSTLLLWNWNRDMDTELASFDLATLSRVALGSIRIPETPGLNYARRVLSDFSVSPDGQSLLCTTFLGPPAEHQEEHASSPRWAVARLISDDPRYAAEITEVAPWALNGDPRHELTHRAVQWTAKAPEEPVTLHASLR